jgi:3-phenylpropionate/trans-cinnamate dioxygenase ferredoxin subunit
MVYEWHKIEGVDTESLPPEKITEMYVLEKYVALLKKGTTIYAFAGTCPHSGAKLCEGWLDVQGRVVCPLHKYRFDPANGHNTSGEGYKLRTYKVMIQDNHIYISLPAPITE